ncbi:hypothetical protein E2C01_004212 [Portunus trituberculatus]|uniref:Uncharacterized protein n=1 Tax=Portunus trituberculatus TaxID=210409 RepID=A0A5B7CQS7_PORTR|nr:hypothetical protein [Portunus trituberculatus]
MGVYCEEITDTFQPMTCTSHCMLRVKSRHRLNELTVIGYTNVGFSRLQLLHPLLKTTTNAQQPTNTVV